VSEHASLLAGGASKKKAAATVAAMRPPKLGDKPRAEDEEATSSGADYEMFFTQPKQLVDIFTQLEEQNLFLIQNSQETEQALEEVRQVTCFFICLFVRRCPCFLKSCAFFWLVAVLVVVVGVT
jgi:hypothetical protein